VKRFVADVSSAREALQRTKGKVSVQASDVVIGEGLRKSGCS
jgi:hypothetical protein